MLICGICAYFVFNNFYKLLFPKHITFDLEVAKCDMIGEWLKKKNIEETALYGFSDTLTTRLDKVGIKVNSKITNAPSFPTQKKDSNPIGLDPREPAIPVGLGPVGPIEMNGQDPTNQMGPNGPIVKLNSDPKLNEYFIKVKKSSLKSIIFQDGLQPKDSISELKAFLSAGGYVYFRSYSDDLIDNEPLHEFILEYLKKGQICIVLQKFPDGDVRRLSMKNRVLAENNFIEDSNCNEFDKWHKELVKRKAEFLKQTPPPHP